MMGEIAAAWVVRVIIAKQLVALASEVHRLRIMAPGVCASL